MGFVWLSQHLGVQSTCPPEGRQSQVFCSKWKQEAQQLCRCLLPPAVPIEADMDSRVLPSCLCCRPGHVWHQRRSADSPS